MKKLIIFLFILPVGFISGQSFEKAISLSCQSIEATMDSQQLPGVAVAVFAQGKLWSQGFGYSDLENKVPIIPQVSRFRIGSISKSLTAVALARLYDQNKLDPEAELQEYTTKFPDKGHPILIKQLAGHLAGIRHYQGAEFLMNQRFNTVQSALTIFKNDPLLFMPGERYSYSSYGWNLLSLVIEEITRQSYLQYMEDSVFLPLEMYQTVPEYAENIVPGRVRFYQKQFGKIINCPPVDNSYKWAGGGFLSTADDLMKFARAHLDLDFYKESTFEYFTTPLLTNSGESTGYGLGWRKATDEFDRTWVGHSGGSVGGTSIMMIFPSHKVVVILLTNFSQANIGRLSMEIAHAFMSE